MIDEVKIQTFYQSTAPQYAKDGDLWLRSQDLKQFYYQDRQWHECPEEPFMKGCMWVIGLMSVFMVITMVILHFAD